jgi:cytochrome c
MVVMGLEFKLTNEGAAAVEAPKSTSENTDFFAGKWTAKMIGTPGGDVPIDFIFERSNGKLSGKMVSEKMGSQALDKVEEIDGEKIKVFFQANGMSINIEMSKEDSDNFKGRLMGMFDVKGTRVKQ